MIRHFATIAFISCFAISAQDKPIDFSSLHPLACPLEIVQEITNTFDPETIMPMISGSIDDYHVDLSNISVSNARLKDAVYGEKIPLFLYPYFMYQLLDNKKLFGSLSDEDIAVCKNGFLDLQKSFCDGSAFASSKLHRSASLSALNYLSLKNPADIELFEENDILHLRSWPGRLSKFNDHDRSGLNPVICFIRSVEADKKSFSTDKKRLECIANYLFFIMLRGFDSHQEVSDCFVNKNERGVISVITYPDKKIIIHKWLEEKYNELVNAGQADDGYLHKAFIASTFFGRRLINYHFRRQKPYLRTQPSDLFFAAQNSRFSDVVFKDPLLYNAAFDWPTKGDH